MIDDRHTRLSSISTLWSVLRDAHEGDVAAAATAQQLLLRRYGEAVRRYLLIAVGDHDLADELTQEFSLALVRGSYRGADPQRGRFRSYVKGVLFHLVSQHRRQQKGTPAALPPDSPALAALAAPAEDLDRHFDEGWRAEVLAHTWDALADARPTFYAVLRLKGEHPGMPSAQMAARLSGKLGKPLTADGIRQTLRRARQLYAELLIEEVARQLDPPTVERITEELSALNLLRYCQAALDRYARKCQGD
jgi:RNA polymerase sigma-70 factor (ECF subfamily)